MRRISWILALCMLLPATGHAQVTAWFAPSTTKVLRDARPVPGARQWELAAARNETEACQLVLLSEQPVTGLKVTVSEFRRGEFRTVLYPALYKVEYVPDIVGDTPQEFDAYIKAEIPKWTAIVKASGATLDQ